MNKPNPISPREKTPPIKPSRQRTSKTQASRAGHHHSRSAKLFLRRSRDAISGMPYNDQTAHPLHPHREDRYLVDNFDVILLPAFETSDMVARGQRRIRSKTVRNLLSFAHHRFRNFLKHKASENGRTVLIVNEADTSKTVSWTGEVNHKLG